MQQKMKVISQHDTHSGAPRSSLTAYRSIPARIGFRVQNGIALIDWRDIMRCQSDSNYTEVHLADGSRIVVSKTLAEVESVLPSMAFQRIHKSHCVNLRTVCFVGKEEVRLASGEILPVARSRRKELQERVGKMSTVL